MKTHASEPKKLKKTPRSSGVWIIIFAVFFVVIGGIFLVSTYAAPKNRVTTNGASLYLNPSSQTVKIGDSLDLAIRANTGGQATNAVQAGITYPADKFDFVSIDSTGSAFDVDVPVSHAAGTVQISRGSFTPVNSSSALVATLRLRAKSSGRKLQVKFADGSMLLSSQTNLNILQNKTGGTYTVR